MKKRKKLPEGWVYADKVLDGGMFRFNTRSDVQWKVTQRGKVITAESTNSNRTIKIARNKAVYLEY